VKPEVSSNRPTERNARASGTHESSLLHSYRRPLAEDRVWLETTGPARSELHHITHCSDSEGDRQRNYLSLKDAQPGYIRKVCHGPTSSTLASRLKRTAIRTVALLQGPQTEIVLIQGTPSAASFQGSVLPPS